MAAFLRRCHCRLNGKRHEQREQAQTPASMQACRKTTVISVCLSVALSGRIRRQIFQSPGYVVIAPEMIHSARIIPLDGRPHLGKNLRQWLGDTRGRWEGNTLVIETTNFRTDDGVVFQAANPATYKITERLTRVAPDSISYEFTVEDPTTWSTPWSAVIPWTKIDPAEQMYEYGCHEDNFDIVHLLSGARTREKNGEGKR